MTALAALFERHLLRAIVEAVVEGRLGRVDADDATSPSVARLSLGCYAIVGGDPTHALARDLVASVSPPREIVYGNDPAWRRLILDVHGGRVSDRPMTIFDASRIDIYDLVGTTVTAPPDYDLVPMDASHARQLDHELEPHAMQVFASPERFEGDGMGYAILTHPGGTVVSAATSYAMSARRLEVAIATRPAHRGRGLAEVAAAALAYHALDACLVPEWSASNPVSKRLAERLGYRPAGECEVLLLA